jgi:exosome complex component RRP42
MIEIDIELIKEIAGRNERIDGRPFDKYRAIKIQKNFILLAEGSAQVRIGDTEVVAGVKFGTGEPFPDTPDEGVLMVGAELLPLASPEFESGPPGAQAIELARVVDRAIRESKCIDFKKLAINPEKVWMIHVDIDVLDDDGNLIDAASLASAAALSSAQIPALDEDGKINIGKKTGQLPMSGLPISTTFVKINNRLMADPNIAEYKAMDARLTVGTINTKDGIKLCSMQKGGSSGLTIEEVEQIIEMAIEKGEELRQLVKEAQ